MLRGARLGIALTLAPAGCSLVTQSPPQVDVANVALTSIGLFNQSFLVTLCVTNQNHTSVAFRRVMFMITVADAPLADGATESAVAVPALSSVLVPVAAQTTIRNSPGQLLSTLETGAVAYRLSGVVHLASLPSGVPFSRAGPHRTMIHTPVQTYVSPDGASRHRPRSSPRGRPEGQKAHDRAIERETAAQAAEQWDALGNTCFDQRESHSITILIIRLILKMQLDIVTTWMNVGSYLRQQHAVDHLRSINAAHNARRQRVLDGKHLIRSSQNAPKRNLTSAPTVSAKTI